MTTKPNLLNTEISKSFYVSIQPLKFLPEFFLSLEIYPSDFLALDLIYSPEQGEDVVDKLYIEIITPYFQLDVGVLGAGNTFLCRDEWEYQIYLGFSINLEPIFSLINHT